MGKSYVSIRSHSESPSQNPRLWMHDTDACILSFMIGLELLTDVTLDDWAASAGRNCLHAAVVAATGAIDPELYEHNQSIERLRTIHGALLRVLDKLHAYGNSFPGRYFLEHNMLLPGEPVPPDLPTEKLLLSTEALKAEVEHLMAERFNVVL
ncbi:MAG: hypothetical protein QM813_06140 [Verrucomicrobiota bacterium]